MTRGGHADAAMVRRHENLDAQESRRQRNRVSIPVVAGGQIAAGVKDVFMETDPQSNQATT